MNGASQITFAPVRRYSCASAGVVRPIRFEVPRITRTLRLFFRKKHPSPVRYVGRTESNPNSATRMHGSNEAQVLLECLVVTVRSWRFSP